MQKSLEVITCALALLLSSTACARAESSARAGAAHPAGGAPAAQERAASRPQSFVTVEGADLSARLAEAARRARSAAPPAPYWTAYGFDVRPGVAVDPAGGEFHGSMNSVGGTHVFVGTSNGMTVETRNLAVFLLRAPGTVDGVAAVTRLEIYNLDRPREYGGYTVYWAGRAGNEESLGYLRPLLGSDRQGMLAERAALALALHDDARVPELLKGLVRGPASPKVRSTAVFWLGQGGGETAFLADLVRSQREDVTLRRQAAHAIGASRDRSALTTLEGLYTAVAEREVKRGIIHAVAENENRDAAYAFLLRVATTDPESEARRTAVHELADTGRESAVDDLMKIYSTDQDREIRRQAIHALSEIESPRAEAKLFEIARGAADPELRRHAIHQLGERDTEATLDELSKIFDAERSPEVRRQILHAFSEMKSPRAEDKLFEIARRAEDMDLRRQAIHRLGERAGERSLAFLRDTVQSSAESTEVQIQALRAIAEKPAEQSVPLLISVARTHPNPQVRKAAIRQLGESGDPRALEFFREVLSK